MCEINRRSYYYHLSECSGNGMCVNNTCVCYTGWTDITDFSVQPGLDCDINLYVLYYLGIISGIVSGIAAIAYIKYIISNNFMHDFDKNEKTFTICLFIFNVSIVGLSFTRPCSLHQSGNCTNLLLIGKDPGSTVGAAICLLFLNIGISAYIAKCMDILSKFNHVVSTQAQKSIIDTIAAG